MQDALFTIELKGHSYVFAFGNIVSVDADEKSFRTFNSLIKDKNRNIRTTWQDVCINRPYTCNAAL